MAPAQRFEAVEQLETQLRSAGLDLRLSQLSNGRLDGSLLFSRLGPLRLLRLQANRRLHVAGGKPRDQRMVALSLLPHGSALPLRAHGTRIGAEVLFGLDPRGEVHLSTPERMDLALLLLEPTSLTPWSDGPGGLDLETAPFRANLLPIATHHRVALRGHLLNALSFREGQFIVGAGPPPPLPGRPEGALMPLLAEALGHGLELQGAPTRPPARIALVKQLQDWVMDHPEEPISLETLCQQVHVGRRCLIQGFQEHLGLGPMAYFKLQRLHGVRRALLAAGPDTVTISGLAASWGFLNPGHFARDYSRLFGELPSATRAAVGSPGSG
jgi:AraC family transcriptional regulator, ethanolamine operon transcriptional activator